MSPTAILIACAGLLFGGLVLIALGLGVITKLGLIALGVACIVFATGLAVWRATR